MRLRIIAVGNKMPGWVQTGFAEYRKRIPSELKVEMVEIPPGKRGKNLDPVKAVAQEREAILRAVGNDRVIALEVTGNIWSTEQLAEKLADWQRSGQNLSMLIGGPNGLDRQCLERAEQCWSLSHLTLPHTLVRVVLMEQLYRAWSINAGHPYHRG